VTRWRAAIEALRLSEERYALAMEASNEGHFDYDIETGALFISDRLNEIYGFATGARFHKRSEFISRVPFYREDREKYHDTIRAVEAKGGPERYQFEYRIARSSGEIRWLLTRAKVLRDAEGRARRRVGVIADITDQKRIEGLLAGEKALLEMMARAMPLSKVLDALCRIVEENCGECACSILLVDGGGICLEHGAAPSLPREYQEAVHGAPIGPDIGPCARAAFLKEQVVSIDLAAEAEWVGQGWHTLALSLGLRACWSTPIVSSGNRALGTFALYHRQPSRPTGADQAIIERFTHLAAVAIERSRAEKELRESEARFRGLTELWSDWYWQQDESLRFTYSSAAIDPPPGYPGGSAVGLARWELPGIVPLSSSWAEHRALLAARKPFRDFEYSRPARDGTLCYVSTSGTPIFDENGEFRGYQGVARDITERRKAAEDLRKSEARFRALTELSSDWYWAQDEDMRFTYFSGRREDWAGYPTGTSMGKTRWEIEGVKPMTGSWAEHWATLEARRPFRDFEYMRLAKNGGIVYASASGTPVFDEGGRFVGYQGVSRDITERKRIEEELRSRTEMLELAQKAAGAVAWEWTADSDSNRPPRRADTRQLDALFGLPPGSYDGTVKAWSGTVHPEDVPRVKAAMAQASVTGDIDVEYRTVRADGGVRWLNAKGRTFLDADGKPTRSVGFLIDVTERHKAEDELRRVEQELRRAQSLEAIGTLAGGIAHDFNNILGAILGYGEMAMRGAKKGTRLRRDLESIMAAGDRGRALVERILAFSRSGVGERVPVHVEAVVREALDQVAASVAANVSIVPRLHAGQAAMLGDPTQVHQVVMNLATNAVQAMPQGGVLRVTLEAVRLDDARQATVGSIAPGDYIVLGVSDTGTGIPEDVLERMFDPFFTTKEVGVGSGLGLSLVHGIVTSVSGAIDVTTRADRGTSFTVYLRRSGDAAAQPADESRPLPRGEGQRVLVVDDEEPLVRLATETLESLGYAPVGFTSSIAALAAFRAEPARFDAVLTDERMPGMSGSALIREVRGIRDTIPIVLMSGYPRLDGEAADVIVRKPLSARDLAAGIARALRP